MITTDEMRRLIVEYITQERSLKGISDLGRTMKDELSGESHGEISLLLDRQLLTTEIGYGSWAELDNIEVLEGVYRLVGSRMMSP